VFSFLFVFSGEAKPDPGWVHMMAALLAVDHFNDRNPTVIEELALPELVNCPFRLVNVTVIDTGTESHIATKTLLKRIQNVGAVDALAGPYDDLPALELSVLATGMESPIVAFRGLDQSLVLPDMHPFFSQVYPDLNGEMEFVGKFLNHTNRTKYIAVLHSNENAVLQRVEVLQKVLRQMKIDHVKTFGYQGLGTLQDGDDRGIEDAIRQISKTGYRTILVILTSPDLDSPEIGRAAHEYELDRGDHFWIMLGGLDPSSSTKMDVLADHRYTPEGQHLRGMAYLYIFDAQYIFVNSTFQRAIREQNMTFIQKLVDMTPVPNYFSGSFCEHDAHQCEWLGMNLSSVLQMPTLSERLEFAYDAVMAIGIGACNALTNHGGAGANTTAITGEQHVEGIQAADFKGVTGRVRFKNLPGTPGSRDGGSVYFGVLNLNRRDANNRYDMAHC
jgi:Receptor family ligand binding region